MKVCLVFSWLLLIGLPAWGQSGGSFRLFFRFGRVVLASHDTLDGSLAVQLVPDRLFLSLPNGQLRAFDAAEVVAFVVQNEMVPDARGICRSAHKPDSTVVHLFRSITDPNDKGSSAGSRFYEQISAGTGPVLLLRRPCRTTRTVTANTAADTPELYNRPGANGARGFSNAPTMLAPARLRTMLLSEVRDMYFLAWPTGEVRAIRAPKKDVFAAFPRYTQQLQEFTETHHLDCSKVQELRDLVHFANSLEIAAR